MEEKVLAGKETRPGARELKDTSLHSGFGSGGSARCRSLALA